MTSDQAQKIFKASSTTYYNSSLFFPKSIRSDVFNLYAFVRTADNFVDQTSPLIKKFDQFYLQTKKIFSGQSIANPIITNFYQLCQKYSIDQKYVFAFLNSMKLDLTKKRYQTYSELLSYVYGSADCIGIFMAKIMKLPNSSYKYAKLLGRAMQLTNFVRDIQEDLDLGRVYIPQTHLKKFNIKNISSNETNFSSLISYEISICLKIFNHAKKGFKYIPPKYLLPIKTATDIYIWTAKKISNNPSLIFQVKIKPKKIQVFFYYFKNIINYGLGISCL